MITGVPFQRTVAYQEMDMHIPEEVQKFTYIARSPITFSVAGGYAAHFGSATLGMRIRRFAYVGINSIEDDTFLCHGMSVQGAEHMEERLLRDSLMLHRMYLLSCQMGLTQHGLGFRVAFDYPWYDQSAIVTALGIAVLLQAGKWTTTLQENLFLLKPDEWIALYPEEFAYLWKLHVIASETCDYPFCGAELVCSLFPSRYPLLYMLGYQQDHLLLRNTSALSIEQLAQAHLPRSIVIRLEDFGIEKPFPVEVALLHESEYHRKHFLPKNSGSSFLPGDVDGLVQYLQKERVVHRSSTECGGHVSLIHNAVLNLFDEMLQAVDSQNPEQFLQGMYHVQMLLKSVYFVQDRPVTHKILLQAWKKETMCITEKMAGKHMRFAVFARRGSQVFQKLSSMTSYYTAQEQGIPSCALAVHNSIEHSIVLDTVKQKLVVNGVQLTSKILPSSRYLFSILEYCFRGESEVPLGKLPVSSYTSEKRELRNKVLLPFSRYLEQVNFPCGGPYLETSNGNDVVIFPEELRRYLQEKA